MSFRIDPLGSVRNLLFLKRDEAGAPSLPQEETQKQLELQSGKGGDFDFPSTNFRFDSKGAGAQLCKTSAAGSLLDKATRAKNLDRAIPNYPELGLEFRFPILICHCDSRPRFGFETGECMPKAVNCIGM
jgi:hypothetical protein